MRVRVLFSQKSAQNLKCGLPCWCCRHRRVIVRAGTRQLEARSLGRTRKVSKVGSKPQRHFTPLAPVTQKFVNIRALKKIFLHKKVFALFWRKEVRKYSLQKNWFLKKCLLVKGGHVNLLAMLRGEHLKKFKNSQARGRVSQSVLLISVPLSVKPNTLRMVFTDL